MKKIVISGASSGLGASLAKEIASQNTQLLLLARRFEQLEGVANVCTDKGAIVTWKSVDLRNIEKVKLLVSEFAPDGDIELLIANAGSLYLETWPQENGPNWNQILSQTNDNLIPTLALLESVLSIPTTKKINLHCVIISSLNAFFPVAEAPGYSIAKNAQKVLVDVLDDYYKMRKMPSKKIFFSTVFPGFINTGMALNYPGPRPFECSSQKAATIIQRAIKKKKKIIIFPKRLALVIVIAKLLPKPLVRYLIHSNRAFRDVCP